MLKAVLASLVAIRWNVDVSTINNSKRSASRWAELVVDAEHKIAMATEHLKSL